MAVIANLTKVDVDGRFEGIFEKYYSNLNSEYMVTVANTVGYSAKIAEKQALLGQRNLMNLLQGGQPQNHATPNRGMQTCNC